MKCLSLLERVATFPVVRLSILFTSTLCVAANPVHAKTLEELLVEKGVVTQAEVAGTTPSSAAVAPNNRIYWDRGSVLEFPDQAFSAKIETQLAPRYEYVHQGNTSSNGDTSSFTVRRARIIVSGTALSKEFSYKVETDMVGQRTDQGQEPTLLDGFIRWNPTQNASAQMGQFKSLVSRQEQNSSATLQFPDRTVASNYFNLGYQEGAAGGVVAPSGIVEAKVAVFDGLSQGEGLNRPGVDTKMTMVGGVRFNPVGKMNAYEEGDVDYTQDAALSFGAVYAYSDLQDNLGLTGPGNLQSISTDANFKMQGISVHAEFYVSELDPEEDDGQTADPIGFYIQTGYFLEPKKFEVATRYSRVDCDSGTAYGNCAGNDSLSEGAATLNYYWWKHHLKAQLAYEYLTNVPVDGQSQNQNKWIFQISSWF